MSAMNGPAEHRNADWTIADPGHGLAIPVDKSGVCPIVTAAAETRKLFAPTYVGQEVTLVASVMVGAATITVYLGTYGTTKSTFNQDANNTLVLTNAGEWATFRGVKVAGVLIWRLMACNPIADGGAISTVA